MTAWLRRWLRRWSRERARSGPEAQRAVEALVREQQWTAAIPIARDACRQWPENPDLWLLAGEIALELEDPREAWGSVRRAQQLAPERADVWVLGAAAALECAAFADALAQLDRADQIESGRADSIYQRAMVWELQGEGRRAQGAYRQAAELEPDRFFVPTRVSAAQFDRMVRRALDRLPEPMRQGLANLDISTMAIAPQALLFEQQPPLNPTLMGVCIGATHAEFGATGTESAGFDALLPARIIVFQRNHERGCRDAFELAEQVVITVFHEVGHYFGLDEHEVDARGLA